MVLRDLLEPTWHETPDAALKALQRIGRALDYANRFSVHGTLQRGAGVRSDLQRGAETVGAGLPDARVSRVVPDVAGPVRGAL